MNDHRRKPILLLSGGLDSAVLLAMEVEAGSRPPCLSFSYGQRHESRESACAVRLADRYGVHLIRELLPVGLLWGGALTGGESVPHAHHEDPVQAATVIPNRNMVLLALAAAVAVRRGCTEVLFAAHAGDAAIYRDCRPEFARAADAAMRLACGVGVSAPFLGMTKRDVVTLGRSFDVPFEMTWSCYSGGDEPCGLCGACCERAWVLA